MKPDELIIIITILLMLGYGLSQAYSAYPRIKQWWHIDHPVQQLTRVIPRRVVRTVQDRAMEARLIQAGLDAGLSPYFIARSLRGNVAWNRRRIKKLGYVHGPRLVGQKES